MWGTAVPEDGLEVHAVLWGEEVDELSDGVPKATDGSRGGLALNRLTNAGTQHFGGQFAASTGFAASQKLWCKMLNMGSRPVVSAIDAKGRAR
jgi:hypothetical protein